MKYQGSKNKYAKRILSYILPHRNGNDQYWVEPFAGGMNMIDKVNGKRIANDVNPFIIEMFQQLVNGVFVPPDSVSEELYNDIKQNKNDYNPALVAFVGIGCSFGAKWFSSYARSRSREDYCGESKRNVLRQKELLKGVVFIHGTYSDLSIPKNSIIYCDPPYEGTAGYGNIKFDNNKFWNWARQQSNIFISEYTAPADFKCIWQDTTTSNLNNVSGSSLKKIEKLFVHESETMFKGFDTNKQISMFDAQD